jgi:putative membrane protein
MTDQPPDASTRLAADRTRLASERTLMAWIRTCTSLIAFGFTIYQFFLYQQTNERLRREPIVSPEVFGVLMIFVGLTALAEILSSIPVDQGFSGDLRSSV